MKRLIFRSILALLVCSLPLMTACSPETPADGTTTSSVVTTTTTGSSDPTMQTDVSTTTGTGDSDVTTTQNSTGTSTTTQKETVTTTTKKPDPVTTTTTGTPVKNSQLKAADYISNAELWETPGLGDGSFYFEVEMTSIGTRNAQLLKNSIKKLQVGEYVSPFSNIRAAEWGYSVLNLPTGSTDGAGRVMNNTFLDNPPSTRAEAISKLKEFVLNQYVRGEDHPWYSMNGHHSWHHYAAEFGFDVLASEIGENIHGYQFHIAMNRGAARQYNKPWAIDFSSWHGAGILDYSGTPIWGDYSGTNRGHSLNLVERSFVMSYMSGADSVVAEAGAAISFYEEVENGLYKITPYGELCRDFNAFTKEYDDVGITYTPIAVALDYYHGMDRHSSGNKAFGRWSYNDGDQMTHDLVDMIWPGTWAVERNGNETGTLSNGPYGDTIDFVLQNASQEVLNSYPAIILSGDITLTNAEVARYQAYVNQGGILVLNTAYVDQFSSAYKGTLSNNRYDKNIGKGRVIVYGPDYDVSQLDGIIEELLAEFMPFSVSTDIQYMVNIRDGYMYVTLMNSDGVTKTSHGTVQINQNKGKMVTLTYRGDLTIDSVTEIYADRSVELSDKSLSLRLAPGEIVIFEFAFK